MFEECERSSTCNSASWVNLCLAGKTGNQTKECEKGQENLVNICQSQKLSISYHFPPKCIHDMQTE